MRTRAIMIGPFKVPGCFSKPEAEQFTSQHLPADAAPAMRTNGDALLLGMGTEFGAWVVGLTK